MKVLQKYAVPSRSRHGTATKDGWPGSADIGRRMWGSIDTKAGLDKPVQFQVEIPQRVIFVDYQSLRFAAIKNTCEIEVLALKVTELLSTIAVLLSFARCL